MRVKLIGVSDEARKSESVARANHNYPPLTAPLFVDHEIDTAMPDKFDGFAYRYANRVAPQQ